MNLFKETKVVVIDLSQENNQVSLNTPSVNQLFKIEGKFIGWGNGHPKSIEISLDKKIPNHYYDFSKCNFCKKSRHLELHIERLHDGQPENLSITYNAAKQEGLQFIPNNGDTAIYIHILVYNNRKNEPESNYFVCKGKGEPLKYPRYENDRKSLLANSDGGFQPDTSEGNIILGGD